MNSQRLTDEYVNAIEAVEDRLKIGDFIERHPNQILNELEEAAQETETQEEFLAKALPFIDSVIQVASGRNDYMNALQWAKGKRPAVEPHRWLIRLTLVYIVRKGLSERSEDVAKRGIWNTIISRVGAFLKDDAAKESAAGTPSPKV